MESDDLEFCKFYKYLQTQFRHLYDNAQDRQLCICVPRNDSVLGAEFSLDFVEHHILKPSPFFMGEYETSHLGKPCTLTIDGFPNKIKVRILKEEQGYNKNYKPYKILIIEKPLIPIIIDKSKQEQERSLNEPLRDLYLYDECKAFLESFPECAQVLRDLKESTTAFTTNYLVLPQYLDDATSRLRHIYDHALQEFLDTVESENKSDERFINNSQRAIENVILYETHSKVFSAVCKVCRKSQNDFVCKLETLKKVSAEALGVGQNFICDMTNVIASLKQIEELTTPLELLCKMQHILDSIVKTVNAHIASQKNSSSASSYSLTLRSDVSQTTSKQNLITADDVIPLLVHVIVKAGPSQLVSILHFIQNFHWSTSPADNLSYSLVTFQAATQYILNLSEDQLYAPGSSSEAAQASASDYQTTQHSRSKYSSTGQTDSRLDRQMDRINRMVNTSNLLPGAMPGDTSPSGIVRPARPLSTQRARSRQGQSAQLGSFLTSLKKDSMECSFGKQS